MTQNSAFLARILKSSARTYAGYASGELIESLPAAEGAFAKLADLLNIDPS